MKIKSRLTHYILLGLVVASTLTATLSPIVSAQGAVDAMSPTDVARSWQYYNALSFCISKAILRDKPDTSLSSNTSITKANAESGNWFQNALFSSYQAPIGYFLTDTGLKTNSKGQVDCGGDNTDWVSAAAKLWGYSNTIGLLCDSGAGRKNKSDCQAGSEDFESSTVNDSVHLNLAKFRANVGGKIYGGAVPSLTQPSFYPLYQKSFFAGCLGSATPTPYTGSATDNFAYDVTIVDMTSLTASPARYYGLKQKSDSIDYAVNTDLSTAHKTCQELAQETSSFANIYSILLKADPKIAQAEKKDIGAVTGKLGTPGTTTCAIDGIGWIVCPVLGFMGTITDTAFNFLASNFLETKSSVVSAPATKNAWDVMRNIANVAFVIAFLVIIFSQLSSVGITNYGVKKMLPRLVIAAILVNVSFFICQIAVDISNILGYSLKNVFDGLQNYTQTPGSVTQDATGNGWGIGAIVVTVLAGGVSLALAVTIPVLLAALLALMMIVLILFGRTALIILLVVISPLAFVAYLLPNTEQWFKKWFKMFSSLLLVFPIIAVVVGASGLAAGILKASAGNDIMLQVVAMGVATVPLFVVPSLLKNSLSAAGTLGTQLAGLSSKATGKIGGKVRDTSRLGEILKNRQANSLQNRANRRTRGFQSALDSSRIGRSLGFDKGAARAINTVNSADNEEVDASERLMKYGVDPREMMGHAANQLTQANATGDSVKARAATKILLNQGAPGVRRLHTTLDAAEATPGGMHRNVSGDLRKMLLESGIKARDNALGQWSFDPAARSISDITSGRGTGGGNAVTGLTPVELAGHEAELLRHWGNNGLVTTDQARRTVAAVASGNISMDDTKLAVFQAISTGAAMPAPPPGTSPIIY